MRSVAIERKNPIRMIDMLNSKIREDITCTCPFCNGKIPASLAEEKLAKKHFLYRRNEEIDILRKMNTVKERVEFIEKRIDTAIIYHKALKPVFKPDDYKYLIIWKDVISKLKEKWM